MTSQNNSSPQLTIDEECFILSKMASRQLVERIKQLSEEIEAYQRWRSGVS